MKDVNKTFLVGSVGSVDYRNNGVVSMSIATNSFWKDKTGEQQKKTEWHRVTLFSQLGARVRELGVNAGSRVMVDGALRLNVWNKDGVEQKSTEIIANSLELLVVKKRVDQNAAVQQGQAIQPVVQQQVPVQNHAPQQYEGAGEHGY